MKKKLLFGTVMSIISILGICGIAYASGAVDPSAVSGRKDNITFEKSAEWVKYKGNYTDENGNPYAQIDIKTKDIYTEQVDSVEEREESVDVVLVLDCSYSMITCNRLDKSKAAALKFIDYYFARDNGNLRAGVVLFSDWVVDACNLTSDKETVKQKILESSLVGETNIQSGLWLAQRMLSSSVADKKYIVLLSDGAPSVELRRYSIVESCRAYYRPEEFILTNESIFEIEENEVAKGENIIDKTINQARFAEKSIENLQIMTIGFDTSEAGDNVLNAIASEDEENQRKYFYKGNSSFGANMDLNKVYQIILNNIDKRKGYTVSETKISDQLPEGIDLVNYEVIEGCSPSRELNISDDGILTWEFNNEDKIIKHHIRLIVTVNTDVLDKEYWNLTSYINTNGKSMDISVDSSYSAVLEYKYDFTGEWDKIGLCSPQLDTNNIYVEKDDGKILEPTPEPIQEINQEPILDIKPEIIPRPPFIKEQEPISKPMLEKVTEPILEPTVESKTELSQEPTLEPVMEIVPEITLEEEPFVEEKEETLSEELEETVNIEDEKVPLNNDEGNSKKILPIIVDNDLDDTPKTGYPDDQDLDEYKNQYLIIGNQGKSGKKYVLKNIYIAMSVLVIIFSTGFVLFRRRKE